MNHILISIYMIVMLLLFRLVELNWFDYVIIVIAVILATHGYNVTKKKGKCCPKQRGE